MKRALLLSCGMFLLSAAVVGSAQAGVISNPGPLSGASQIQARSPMGQSFVAIDSRLTSIGFAFQTFNPSFGIVPVKISLLAGDGLDGSILAERELVPPDAGLGSTTLSFADFTGTSLTIGDSYTARISTTNPYWGIARTSDTYGDGTGYLTFDGVLFAGGDFVFQVTGTSVPEPASWAMLIAGFGLSGAAIRRRPVGTVAAL